MYVYYVEIMCVGRIGLACAHDIFPFACHTFMHFSCIRTIFFILLTLNVLVLFCLSLSLSYYFDWKSTLSRNPLRSKASSSSPLANSTPSHIRIHDDKARKDFSENFSRRGIHSERQVILSDFSNTDFPTVIYSRGWESLYGISVTCPSMIIQEFYSNMHEFDYFVPHFVTRVRGTRIVVTPNLISEVLHVPRVEFANYPDYERLRTVSNDELSSCFYEIGVTIKTLFVRALQKVLDSLTW